MPSRAMKRLLICTPTHTLHGGVERILESLAAQLPRHGYETVFGLAKGSRFNDPAAFRAEFPGLDCVEIDGTSGTATGRQQSMRRVFNRVDPDIVLNARLFDVYPAAAEMKLRGHRLRLAITVQAYEPEYYIDAWQYRHFIDVCNTSGTVTAIAAASVSGIPAERVVAIAGGVAPPRRHRAPSGVLRLGYVGRISTHQKRALDLAGTLIELRRRGVSFTCVIAGTGSEEGKLRELLIEAGLGDAVSFRGWQSTAQLYDEIYPELDIQLQFAEWEGVPIAPREAMAHGVVPVMARFTGMRAEDHFREEVDSLSFAVGDTSVAADQVQRLDRDRLYLEELSSAARLSQHGIRSEEGAAAAWAHALDEALERAQCLGTPPPTAKSIGRLDRHLPAAVAELVRRAFRRRFTHSDPGSEWPHWSGVPDATIIEQLSALTRRAEATDRPLVVQRVGMESDTDT